MSIECIECTTMRQILIENISVESLQDSSSFERFTQFNNAKLELYNHTMQHFKLPYRFKDI